MGKFALGISIGAALKGTFISAVTTGKDKIKGLTGEAARLGKQKIAVDNVKSYRLALSELTATAASAGASNVKFRAKIKEARNALKMAKAEAKDMGINIRKLAAEEKRLETSLNLTNRSLKHRRALEANKQRRSEMHGDLLGAAAPVAAMAVPVKLAIDFESEMADVKKVVDPKAFDGLGKDLLDMSTKIPMAVGGLAKITAAAGQAGIAKSREELIGFAKTAATMGVAFDIGGAESGKMMADWRAGMSLSQAQAVGLADAVNHLSNNMNTNGRDLGEVVQRVGAVGMSAGLTEIQVASLGTALLAGGAGPEIASTALKNLTNAMTKGKAATKAQRDAFDAIGFDAEEMAGRMQENAPAAIKSVFQALKDSPVEEQSALMSQLFGEESKGAIAPLLKNLDNLDKAFDLTADKTKYAGSMQKEYDVRSKTTANNTVLLRGKINRLGINFGAVLLPAVNAVLTPIGAVINLVSAGAEKFPVLTTVVVGAAAGAATLTAATVAGAYAFSFAKDVILKVKLAHIAMKKATIGTTIAQKASAVTTKATAAAQWAWNAALGAKAFTFAKARVVALTAAQNAAAAAARILAATQAGLGAAMSVAFGPVGLIIAAVAAGAILIYKYWQPIKAFFIGFARGVSAAMAPMKAAFAPILSFISPVTNAVGAMFGTIKGWASAMLSPFKAIVSGIKGLFTQSEAGVATAASIGERIGAGLVGGVKFVFMNFTPLGWIIKGFSAAKGFLSGIDWSQPGAAIVRTLVAGIKSVAMEPVEAVKGVLGKVRNLLPFSDAKEGPLSSLTASGKATIVTLETGMRQAQGGLYSRVKDVAGKVAATAAGMSIGVTPVAAMPYSPDNIAPSAYQSNLRMPAPDGQAYGRGQIVVNFNPTIQVTGQGQAPGQDVTQALQLSEERLKRMLAQLLNQDRRVSYA